MADENYQDGEAPSADDVPGDVIVSPDTRRPNRVPPGQSRTRKWPVLDASGTPKFERNQWNLRVFGAVKQPFALTWDEFQQLPRIRVFSDFHCVTRWSRLGNTWEGVSTREILERAQPTAEARFVILYGYDDGWTTNLPLQDFQAEDTLLADLHDGAPISDDHGGPLRAVVPQLYAWKSAKWLCGIELRAEDQPGYWERLGYHNHGDPWTEERFGG